MRTAYRSTIAAMNPQTRLGKVNPLTFTWRNGPYNQAPITAPTAPTNISVMTPGESPGTIQRATRPVSKPRTIQKATAPSTLCLLAPLLKRTLVDSIRVERARARNFKRIMKGTLLCLLAAFLLADPTSERYH
jgi:hypothetical protein